MSVPNNNNNTRDALLAAGFVVHHTGGGCKALALTLPDGGYLFATDGDADVPRDGADVLLGSYTPEGDETGDYRTVYAGQALDPYRLMRTIVAMIADYSTRVLAPEVDE